MADEKKERVDLNSLSDDAYQKVKEQGHDKFKKALSLGYTYTEIANVIRDEDSGVTFTARQIREFCEDNGISKQNDNGISSGTEKAPKQNDNGISSGTEKAPEQNDDVISTGNRNRPKAKA